MARPKAADIGGEIGETSHDTQFWTLVVGSIGVVYGDIGTSPLYAFREAVHAASGGSPANAQASPSSKRMFVRPASRARRFPASTRFRAMSTPSTSPRAWPRESRSSRPHSRGRAP